MTEGRPGVVGGCRPEQPLWGPARMLSEVSQTEPGAAWPRWQNLRKKSKSWKQRGGKWLPGGGGERWVEGTDMQLQGE